MSRNPYEGTDKLSPRAYDDAKDIVRPRLREITRALERLDLVQEKVEAFFGTVTEVTFTDGTGSTVNHNTKDLEVPHSFSVIPSDVIIGLVSTNAVVRRGLKQWTANNIYLRCNAACVAKIYVVI